MRMNPSLRIAVITALVVVLLPLQADAQRDRKKKKKKNKDNGADVVALYKAGAYTDAASASTERRDAGQASVEEIYVGGLAYEALKNTESARAAYAEVASARPESDAWHWLGESARALVAGDVNAATTAADRAVELDANNKYVHYQRGLVLSHRRAYQPAAESFARMLTIDGSFAYGHYYAGLSYYQLRSLVAAANHFERFLELAPEAPERIQVEGILSALRGS